jgi:ABC-type transport system involved in Fe-S cluster assembly fused permease/ATPase subunit
MACQDAMAVANSAALEALSCVRTVIGFAAEDFEHSKYSEKIEAHYLLNVRQVPA